MSVDAISFVWMTSKAAKTELLMLLALADWADENGAAWPGIKALSQKARMTERNAQILLRKLETSGAITIEENAGVKTHTGNTNRYTIVGFVEWLKEVKGISPLKSEGVKNSASRGEKSGTKGVKGVSPKPSDKPLDKPLEEDIADASSDAPPIPPIEKPQKYTMCHQCLKAAWRPVEPDGSWKCEECKIRVVPDAPPSKEILDPPPKVPLKGSPLPPLAPPGFRWLCSSVSDSPMCLIPTASNDRTARPLCKRSVPHRVAWSPLMDKQPCAECVRIAMEPLKLPNETWSTEVKNEFADLCKMNWNIPSNATMMSKYLRDISGAGPVTIENLRRFRANWYKCDFRGKKGSAPKARWISEHWTEYTESDDCREETFNGSADTQQASRGANSTTTASNNGREPGLLADGEKLTQNQRFALLSAQQAERERSRR